MKYIKFNKSICGVDFLMNVIDSETLWTENYSSEVISTDFFQIVFIKSAKGTLQLNQNRINLKDNSVVFVSKNQKHFWDIDRENFQACFLIFQEDFLNEFFADQYFTYRLLYFYQTQYPLQIDVSDNDYKEYISKLSEIKQELVAPRNDSSHFIRSLLYYLLIHLNRNYSDINNIASAIAVDNLAYKFRKLVEKHIYTKQRIEDYVDLLGVNRIGLNKAVKSQFNITASEFIKSKLIFEIKMKLIYTNMTIAEISSELNFSEPNHMSRLFKNRELISPVQYRDKYQNGIS